MPTGHPRIQSGSEARIGAALREMLPTTEVVGEIKVTPAPETPGVTWQTTTGEQVTVADPPPPWETEDQQYMQSDARRYIDVPDNWTLRWVNPRLLESQGWRYWTPVSANDPRVKMKVETMIAPDGTVRRGGVSTGDILAWMYTSWVRSGRERLTKETERLTQSAIDRQEELKSRYGPRSVITVDSAIHPTHTMAEGRSLKQDL